MLTTPASYSGPGPKPSDTRSDHDLFLARAHRARPVAAPSLALAEVSRIAASSKTNSQCAPLDLLGAAARTQSAATTNFAGPTCIRLGHASGFHRRSEFAGRRHLVRRSGSKAAARDHRRRGRAGCDGRDQALLREVPSRLPCRRTQRLARYCAAPACRAASKAASQRQWLAKPENRDYFT